MGVDQTFYCGPFLECHWEGVPATKKVNYCSEDSTHKVRKKDNFCAVCGSGINTKTKLTGELTNDIEWETLEDAIKNRLVDISIEGAPKQTTIWKPNCKIPEIARKTSFGRYEEGFLTFKEADAIRAEVDAFETFFSDEISAIRKQYAKVEIRWGVLSYCW